MNIRISGIAKFNRYAVQHDFSRISRGERMELRNTSIPTPMAICIVFLIASICRSITQLHFIGRWVRGALKIGAICYIVFGINAYYRSMEFSWISVAKFTLSINLDMSPS